MKLRRIDRYRVGLLNEAGMLTSEGRGSYRLEHPADLGLIESMWSAIQPGKMGQENHPADPGTVAESVLQADRSQVR